MNRRDLVLGSTIGLGLMAAGCSTTSDSSAGATPAGKRATINRDTDAALTKLYANAAGSRDLMSKAAGVLIFPSVLAGGFVVGAEYGEGVLRVGGATVDYYKTLGGSFGLQIGAESKAVFILFMTQGSLAKFRASSGWTAGADATVTAIKVGANGSIDTQTGQAEVVGLVVTNTGLRAGLTIDGTKVSKLEV
jgi:lipid-binding SYLF domain-containing protein